LSGGVAHERRLPSTETRFTDGPNAPPPEKYWPEDFKSKGAVSQQTLSELARVMNQGVEAPAEANPCLVRPHRAVDAPPYDPNYKQGRRLLWQSSGLPSSAAGAVARGLDHAHAFSGLEPPRRRPLEFPAADGGAQKDVCHRADVEPVLQMSQQVRICLMPRTASGGVRAFDLMQQGLARHPRVVSVSLEDIQTADFVVWMPGSTRQPPTPDQCPPSKLIIVDFGDGFGPVNYANNPKNYGFYFKRSWVVRRYGQGGTSEAGRVVTLPAAAKKNAYFPISYSLAEQFLLTGVAASAFTSDRVHPITCTLRPSGRGTDVRKQVLEWTKQAASRWRLKNVIAGEVDHGGRKSLQNKNYLTKMRESQIVVTCNPAGWEGDSRTWEALASGALVMVDRLRTPTLHPLIDGVHVAFYDPTNQTDFNTKLKFYLDHPDIARRIGEQGYVYALRYHRTVSRADYLLAVVTHYKSRDGEFQGQPLEGLGGVRRSGGGATGGAPQPQRIRRRRR